MDILTIHKLKCDSVYFDAIDARRMSFSVRKLDRPFNAGDIVSFERGHMSRQEDGGHGRDKVFTPDNPAKSIYRKISYVLTHNAFAGIREGYGVLGLAPLDEPAIPAVPNQEAAPRPYSEIYSEVASNLWDKLAQAGFVPPGEFLEQAEATRRDFELVVAKVFGEPIAPAMPAGIFTTH